MRTNALLKTGSEQDFTSPAADLHTGDATALYTTSMAPAGTDMMCGEATELFTTSMGPSSTMTGAETGAFTTSMVSGTDTLAGEATGLFTTSMTPAK
ncbi:DUF6749 domain-containing protein [uncultured Roseobacter sp.]|uniref:DUF6749 domain-containing protein n=1 Tax=uncultured Roseobacter sp. TaxID=114847 RepID=UPI00260EA7E4|nr:DUF6749 domain-containing protein [uncultured Roseobacter sp.]